MPGNTFKARSYSAIACFLRARAGEACKLAIQPPGLAGNSSPDHHTYEVVTEVPIDTFHLTQEPLGLLHLIIRTCPGLPAVLQRNALRKTQHF